MLGHLHFGEAQAFQKVACPGGRNAEATLILRVVLSPDLAEFLFLAVVCVSQMVIQVVHTRGVFS